MTAEESLNDRSDLKARVLEILGQLEEESVRSQSISRNDLIEEVRKRTGCSLEQADEILAELGAGLRDDGIQGHSPASGTTGLGRS